MSEAAARAADAARRTSSVGSACARSRRRSRPSRRSSASCSGPISGPAFACFAPHVSSGARLGAVSRGLRHRPLRRRRPFRAGGAKRLQPLLLHSTSTRRASRARPPRDRVNACAGCHTAEDLAYGFVNSDRFDAEARQAECPSRSACMRCYAGPMDGFVPTLYDPAVRDIRILARAVAHHLQLSEGARKDARAKPCGRSAGEAR